MHNMCKFLLHRQPKKNKSGLIFSLLSPSTEIPLALFSSSTTISISVSPFKLSPLPLFTPPMSLPKLSLSSNFTPKFSLKSQTTTFPSKSPNYAFNFKALCCQNPATPPVTLKSILRAVPDWADRVQERGMRQKRFLYSHETWAEHRSSVRHLRHLVSSLQSPVILSLIPPVIAFTSVAVFIASYNSAVELRFLPEFLPILRVSSLPYQLTAPALALLLVFRTEASYSRFVEGKKAWIRLISCTDDFARQVIATVDSSRDSVLKSALLQYILAFPVALKCHVTCGSDIGQDLQNLLEGDDLALIVNSKHRPRCIIEFISQSLQLLNLEESKRELLDSKISCLHEGIGVCEQILGVPIPLSYTRLTSRILVLWHLTLPVILWDDCHWIVVPATFISAASLFCIEEVGVLIEEPFPMLPLDELCNLLQSNVKEAIAAEKVIKSRLIAKKKNHDCDFTANGWPKS